MTDEPSDSSGEEDGGESLTIDLQQSNGRAWLRGPPKEADRSPQSLLFHENHTASEFADQLRTAYRSALVEYLTQQSDLHTEWLGERAMLGLAEGLFDEIQEEELITIIERESASLREDDIYGTKFYRQRQQAAVAELTDRYWERIRTAIGVRPAQYVEQYATAFYERHLHPAPSWVPPSVNLEGTIQQMFAHNLIDWRDVHWEVTAALLEEGIGQDIEDRRPRAVADTLDQHLSEQELRRKLAEVNHAIPPPELSHHQQEVTRLKELTPEQIQADTVKPALTEIAKIQQEQVHPAIAAKYADALVDAATTALQASSTEQGRQILTELEELQATYPRACSEQQLAELYRQYAEQVTDQSEAATQLMQGLRHAPEDPELTRTYAEVLAEILTQPSSPSEGADELPTDRPIEFDVGVPAPSETLVRLRTVAPEAVDVPFDAAAHYQTLQELTATGEDPMAVARSINNLGVVAYTQNKPQLASKLFDEAADILHEHDATEEELTALENLAWITDYLDESEATIETCEYAIELIEGSEIPDERRIPFRLRAAWHQETPESTHQLYELALYSVANDSPQMASRLFAKVWARRESFGPETDIYPIVLAAGVGLAARLALSDDETATDRKEILDEIEPHVDALSGPATVLYAQLTGFEQETVISGFQKLLRRIGRDEDSSIIQNEAMVYERLLEALRTAETTDDLF